MTESVEFITVGTNFQLTEEEARGAALYDLWRATRQVIDNYDVSQDLNKSIQTMLELLDRDFYEK